MYKIDFQLIIQLIIPFASGHIAGNRDQMDGLCRRWVKGWGYNQFSSHSQSNPIYPSIQPLVATCNYIILSLNEVECSREGVEWEMRTFN